MRLGRTLNADKHRATLVAAAVVRETRHVELLKALTKSRALQNSAQVYAKLLELLAALEQHPTARDSSACVAAQLYDLLHVDFQRALHDLGLSQHPTLLQVDDTLLAADRVRGIRWHPTMVGCHRVWRSSSGRRRAHGALAPLADGGCS